MNYTSVEAFLHRLSADREKGGLRCLVDIVCWRAESFQVTDVFDEKGYLAGM